MKPQSGPTALLAVVALALVVRVAAFWAMPPLELVGDEIYYTQVAASLARGEGHRYRDDFGAELLAWRPPGHAWLLSLALAGEAASAPEANTPSPTRAAAWTKPFALQIVLGSLLAGAIGGLGAALFGWRQGIVAAVAAALYPNLIAFSHNLWSETLTAVLLASALAAAARWRHAPSLALAASTGALLGAAALTRELALGVAVVLCAWWIGETSGRDRRRAVAHGALVLVLAAAVVAPWTLRNARVLGATVPISTIGWFAAGEGNTFESSESAHGRDWLREDGPLHQRYRAGYFTIRDELERVRYARSWTLERVREEQPMWLGRKLLREGSLLLGPDSYLLFKLGVGAYGERPDWVEDGLFLLTAASWGTLAAFAALGIAAAPGPARRLALWVLSIPALVHLLTNATSRFRIPWLPVLIVFAAYAWTERDQLRTRLSRRAVLAVGLFVGFILLVAFPYYAVHGGRG